MSQAAICEDLWELEQDLHSYRLQGVTPGDLGNVKEHNHSHRLNSNRLPTDRIHLLDLPTDDNRYSDRCVPTDIPTDLPFKGKALGAARGSHYRTHVGLHGYLQDTTPPEKCPICQSGLGIKAWRKQHPDKLTLQQLLNDRMSAESIPDRDVLEREPDLILEEVPEPS
jgi:hypothetical protein